MQEFATTGSRPTCTYMPQTTYIPTLHGRNPRMQDAYMGLQTYTSQTEKATHRALSPNARDYFSWRLGQIDTQPASALEHKNLHYKVGSSARYSPSVQSYTMDTFNDDPDDYGALSHHLAAHMHNNTTSHAKLMYEESAVPGVLKAVIAAAKGSGKALKAAEHATVAAAKSAAHAAAKAEHATVAAGKSAAHAAAKAEHATVAAGKSAAHAAAKAEHATVAAGKSAAHAAAKAEHATVAAGKSAAHAAAKAEHATVAAGKSAAHAAAKAEHATVAAGKSAAHAAAKAEHATVAAGKSAAHAAAKKMTTNKALEAASKKVPKKSKLLVYDTDDSSSDDNKTSSENDEEAHEGDKHHKADNKDIRQNTKDKKRLKMLLAEIAIIHSRHA